MEMRRSVVLALAVFALAMCVAECSRLSRWKELDREKQIRMYHRLEKGTNDQSVPPEEPSERISTAWAYVRNDVCLAASSTFLANIHNKGGCNNLKGKLTAARRGCKAAGIVPGDILLPNCTAAFAKACERFFSVPGQATGPLCDAVGMTQFIVRTPPPGKHTQVKRDETLTEEL